MTEAASSPSCVGNCTAAKYRAGIRKILTSPKCLEKIFSLGRIIMMLLMLVMSEKDDADLLF